MSANWDGYWEHLPPSTPSVEPAYSFVRASIAQTYGGVSGVRVVELGAGRGDISFLLAKDGARVTLIDSSEVALEQSRRLFRLNNLEASFVRMDLLKETIGGRFDVSMSFGLAEHFRGRQRSRILGIHAVGRLAFVAVPNAVCIPYRLWKSALERSGRWRFGTEIPFTKRELKVSMGQSFNNVDVFTTPLSYTLNGRMGIPTSVRWPLDSFFGYQLVGYGRD